MEVEVVTRDKSTKVNVKLEEVEAFISDLIAKMEAEINS